LIEILDAENNIASFDVANFITSRVYWGL